MALLRGHCTDCESKFPDFEFVDGECKEVCGKGYIMSRGIECDDGNRVSGDGCDSDCNIEEFWECTLVENEETLELFSYCIDTRPFYP
jgi:cysteine-rich repeat protein